MRRVFVGVIALAGLTVAALGVSGTAPAQPKVTEVLIGSVLPLTGTFANYGQQYLWSAQTAEDIVNNDYADLQVPLGTGKVVPGGGGVGRWGVDTRRVQRDVGDVSRTCW